MRIAGAFILGAVATTFSLGAHASAKGQAAVMAYPRPPVYSASETYSLKANGKAVQVVAFSKEYDYATFSISDGGCALEIARLDGKEIKRHSITPQKLNLAAEVSGATLATAIDRPLYLIVAVDDLRKLVIGIDPAEADKPVSSGAGILNITAAPYSADATGSSSSTSAIQKAVDDAGKGLSGPGKSAIVYVPAGVFHLSELRLPSNVSLYLEGGAVLRQSGKRGDFKVRYRKKSQNREGTWFIHTADGASNVRIFGRGTIDGDGKGMIERIDLSSHLVVPMNCTGFTMDGVVLRDSGLWGTVVANSRNVTLRNTKHFNYLDMGEDDCVDICNSQDVTVTRSIGISLDDPYSTKTWGEQTDISRQWTGTLQPNRNIVFDDCIAWTRCFAFKIGAGVWKDQEKITVRNSVVHDSAHAIGISHAYGSRDIRNVLFDSIDVERNTMTNLGRSWARIVIDPRKSDGGKGGSVYGVVVRNVTVRDAGTDPVLVQGLTADKAIRGLRFERIRMLGNSAPASSLEQIGVAEMRHADDVTIHSNANIDKQIVEGRRDEVNSRARETTRR